jgi:tRNA pseudouridine55 synthase
MTGGILLLDKPVGLSSNAALQRVRRRYGGIKAGHTGSLDPLASGMLPVCLGEATKLAGELLAGRKCYRFRLALGERRDTGDAEGRVVETCAVPPLGQASARALLASLVGPQLQVPPMFSALKKDGQPLYKLARQGIEVERAPRPIEIHALELLELMPAALDIEVLCSKGTYVRTLAEQIARGLGSCGHLAMLRREYVDPYAGLPMWTLAALEAAPEAPPLLPADSAVPHLPAVHLDNAQVRALRHGQEIRLPQSGPGSGTVRLYDADGGFFGLGSAGADGALRPQRLFVEAIAAASTPVI